MDQSVYVNVDFWDLRWPNASLPSKISKNVRYEFLLAPDGTIFSYDDLKEILKSWLHDEFGACPDDFKFQIAP